MPHVEVWHFPATVSAEDLTRFEQAVVDAVVTTFGVRAGAVSIGLREVETDAWTDTVYQPLITRQDDAPLLRRPDY